MWGENQEETPKSVFKKIISAIEIVLGIILIWIIFFGKPTLMMTDIMASLNGNDLVDNPYLEMVSNHKPFGNGDSYYSAFSQTFDKNEWSYFKADGGQRIVQVVSTYEDIVGDKLITQFAVTPSEDGDSFLIEPYAMRVSGQDLSEAEMGIVLAAVFENDVVNALGEIFFYSSFY